MDQFKLSLPITASDATRIQSTPEIIGDIILNALLQSPTGFGNLGAVIKRDIAELYAGSGLTPTVDHIDITNTGLDLTTGKGKFRMDYVLQRQFGCSDMQTEEMDYMEWAFEINWDKHEINCLSTTPLIWSSYE